MRLIQCSNLLKITTLSFFCRSLRNLSASMLQQQMKERFDLQMICSMQSKGQTESSLNYVGAPK